jgi:hypothetical protein
MPRDPDYGIAHWEVTPEGMAKGIERSSNFGGTVRLVLRIYAIGDDRQRVRSHLREYPVQDWLGSQIVLLGKPGATHQAVIGLRDELGTFSPLVRSAYVQSPRMGPTASPEVAYTRVTPPDPLGSPLRSEPVDPVEVSRLALDSTTGSATPGTATKTNAHGSKSL